MNNCSWTSTIASGWYVLALFVTSFPPYTPPPFPSSFCKSWWIENETISRREGDNVSIGRLLILLLLRPSFFLPSVDNTFYPIFLVLWPRFCFGSASISMRFNTTTTPRNRAISIFEILFIVSSFRTWPPWSVGSDDSRNEETVKPSFRPRSQLRYLVLRHCKCQFSLFVRRKREKRESDGRHSSTFALNSVFCWIPNTSGSYINPAQIVLRVERKCHAWEYQNYSFDNY